MDTEPRLAKHLHHLLQPAPRAVRRNGGAETSQLVGRHVVRADTGEEPVPGQLHVAVPDHGRDSRLVGRLVPAEAGIAIGTEQTRRTKVVTELGEQRLHRRPDVVLVDFLVVQPVGLGIVGLETLEEVQGALGPPLEAHGA